MLKLWSLDEIVEFDNEKYLNEEASKRFYDTLGDMIDVDSKDKFVLEKEATNILNDLENSMFDECINLYSNEYDSKDVIGGKDAFECIKKIGLALLDNGYPDKLVNKELLKEFGELLTNKFENFSFNDDFIYYELLLDEMKNDTIENIIKNSEDVWGINLVLKLCSKYNLSENLINPNIIDTWLLKKGYYSDPKKSKIFLKALCEIIDKPNNYLCGEVITKYFSDKYEIGEAVKAALSSPILLSDYEKGKRKGLTLQDAYKKVTQIYLNEYSEKEDIKEIDIFKFIENIPHSLLEAGFSKEVISNIKFRNIEINLKRLFKNFNLNNKNFELYLISKNKFKASSINELIENCDNNREVYELIYAKENYKLSEEEIDFKTILNKMDDISELINIIKLIIPYLEDVKEFNATNVDEWLTKFYDDLKYSDEIIELIDIISNYMDISLFVSRFDMELLTKDIKNDNLKSFNSYLRTNKFEEELDEQELVNNNDEEKYTIVKTRKANKKDKVYSLIAGSGIISFIQVTFLTKKNPVPVARNFQQLAVASGLIDEIGSFDSYIKNIVNRFNEMMNYGLQPLEKGRVR